MKRKACSTDTAPGSLPSLILLARAGKAISIHRPEGNTIRLGRSSASQIRVNDPHFPRFAGEVILRPTPLFRTPARGQEKSRLQLITPGHPITLSPYKLLILEEGQVFRNRKKTFLKKLKITRHLKPISFVTAAMMVFALTAVGLHQRGGAKNHDQAAVTVPFDIVHRKQFTADKSRDEGKAAAPVHRKSATRPKNAPVKTEPRRHSPSRRPPGHIEEAGFARILKQAEKRLSKYDAPGAGKLITPLLSLLSTGQRNAAIQALNPYAEEIFQKAYILKPFRREESDRMMRELALCGLGLLPGVRKAEGFYKLTRRMGKRATGKKL